MTAYPQELIRASAGSGKTFALSSRIIALLAEGEPPHTIFASTFTRKAAGEILERVLVRLARAALDPEEARELAGHTATDPSRREEYGCAFWEDVLTRTVGALHRLDVGTLDSFFSRAVRSFGYELGLPPGWGIADDPTAARLRAEALQDVLAELDPRARIELVRGLAGGNTRRSVEDAILRDLGAILAADQAVAPGAPGWDAMEAVKPAQPTDVGARAGELAAELAEVPVPLTGKGEPSKNWVDAVDKCVAAIRERDWPSLIGGKLFQAAQESPPGEYYRKPVPPELAALLSEAADLARADLATEYALRAGAMGQLASLYGAAYRERAIRGGKLRFGDVTRLLTGERPLGGREDLFYRLDGPIRHLLLDEFQDTSLTQWDALEPLADTLLEGRGEPASAAAVIVADPKQSIYGWRGAAPVIVERVGDRYGLTNETLPRNYRSSQVVLDAVNLIFRDVEDRWVFQDSEVDRDVAAEWGRFFADHEARWSLAGHVTLSVGPRDPGRGSDRPLLMEYAADRVATLHRDAPDRSIGVLTRTNRAVGRLILELRSRGVAASEEGGTPLTDSAAAASVLALLRLADHPADSLAAYHVARTPIGAAVEFRDPTDRTRAGQLAAGLRRRLMENGYGPTLSELARQLESSCSPRERARLQQLAELGYTFDEDADLRVDAFVRLAETTAKESPGTGLVRVMTVHQAKGLEFDIVVLPELDESMTGGGSGGPLVRREDTTGPATHIFPYMGEDVRRLFADVPEIQEAHAQARAAEIRDALSVLYVATTRAKHALHMIIAADGKNGPGQTRSHARIVREALAPDTLEKGERIDAGDPLFEAGDAEWHQKSESGRHLRGALGRETGSRDIPLRRTGRRRGFERRRPSAGDGTDVAVTEILGIGIDRGALDRGSLVHAWLEELEWIEGGLPGDERLDAIARRVSPGTAGRDLSELRTWLRKQLQVQEVRDALSRDRYDGEATVEAELPFIRRDGDVLTEGIIDRLVLVRKDGALVGAEVLDYKTDAVDGEDDAALRARAEHHAPQLRAYQRAVSEMYGLEGDEIRLTLLFLAPGKTVAVGPPAPVE